MKKGQTKFNWKRTPKIPCSIGNARNTEKNPKSIDLELGIKISSDFTTGFGSELVECSESKRSAAPRMEWESGEEESGRRLHQAYYCGLTRYEGSGGTCQDAGGRLRILLGNFKLGCHCRTVERCGCVYYYSFPPRR